MGRKGCRGGRDEAMERQRGTQGVQKRSGGHRKGHGERHAGEGGSQRGCVGVVDKLKTFKGLSLVAFGLLLVSPSNY